MKLPVDVKKKWVEALRSGEYTQTRNVMYNPKTGGFCCLGVLECEMMDGEVEAFSDGMFKGTPTMDFWEYIGAEVGKSTHGSDDDDPDISALISMNDGQYAEGHKGRINKRKFSTIANWIEKNIEVLD